MTHNVVTNFNDPNDSQGLQKLNTGNLKFLKIWYSWNATEAGELVNSVGHLKFDLSEINPEQVSSAKLYLNAKRVYLQTGDQVAIDIYEIEDDSWTESELIYANKPEFAEEPISHALVGQADKW